MRYTINDYSVAFLNQNRILIAFEFPEIFCESLKSGQLQIGLKEASLYFVDKQYYFVLQNLDNSEVKALATQLECYVMDTKKEIPSLYKLAF